MAQTGQLEEPAAALPPDLVAAHKALRADDAIQFHLGTFKEPEVPEWFKWFEPVGDFIQAAAPIFKFLFWGVVAAVVAAIIYYVAREFGYLDFFRKKADDDEIEEGWAPDVAPARALLAEADALAREGRFAEAAHLILLRSVEDIERRKAKLLKPSSTAREISEMAGLPEKARGTFGLIARHVEASLFGGRTLDAKGWDECREAYGRFALAGEWQ